MYCNIIIILFVLLFLFQIRLHNMCRLHPNSSPNSCARIHSGELAGEKLRKTTSLFYEGFIFLVASVWMNHKTQIETNFKTSVIKRMKKRIPNRHPGN